MGFATKINTSLRGRELGIQRISSAEHGGTGMALFLTGAVEGVRAQFTSAETTSANLKSYGFSNLSTGSSAVHTLDPPIQGVEKIICCTGGATEFVKTANGETLESSQGSTFNTMRFVAYGVAKLVGITTARWAVLNLTSGTSSQGSAITFSTST